MVETKKDNSEKTPAENMVELVHYLDGHLFSLEYPQGRRVQLAMASFGIAIEHLFAIAQLFNLNMYSSAFALIRPLFEATIKGTWIHFCASDNQVKKYAQGKELPSTKLMLEGLKTSKLPSDVFENLNIIQEIGYKVFSSFTHAGYSQVAKWASVNGIYPDFNQEEIDEITNTVLLLGFIAGLESARMSGNEIVIAELSSHIP